MAKELGYFEQENINVAILEPTDPSDVTEMVGTGRADMSLGLAHHSMTMLRKIVVLLSVHVQFQTTEKYENSDWYYYN